MLAPNLPSIGQKEGAAANTVWMHHKDTHTFLLVPRNRQIIYYNFTQQKCNVDLLDGLLVQLTCTVYLIYQIIAMNALQPATQTQSRGSVQGQAESYTCCECVSTGKRGHTPRNANLKLQCNPRWVIKNTLIMNKTRLIICDFGSLP